MEQMAGEKKTALLVMDVQEATVKMLPDNSVFLHTVSGAIQIARSNNIPVIFVVVGFRKGYPEVNPQNKSFSTLKKNPARNLDSEDGYRVHHSLMPMSSDILVVKKRISAFSGSDLEIVLRSLGINHIVLTGISTSGVVLSTLREAADKDYSITVLTDCCYDPDDEVHRVLTTKIFARQAEVLESEKWEHRPRATTL
jgi:nicotinamidase-related amidase